MILLLIPVAIIIYFLMLYCRSGHPDLPKLRGYFYAHRGLHGENCPENSLAAFRKAVENGYGMELDVHLLADGSLAVIHDSSLFRTTGQEGVVEDLTADRLKNYPLEGTEETIPLFSQVLDMVSGKVPLIIELKTYKKNHAALTDAVCRMLENYEGAYCIESFDPFCVRHLRTHHPRVIRGQLSEDFLKSKGKYPWILKWIMTTQLPNFLTAPDFVAYRFQDRNRLGMAIVQKLWRVQGVSWTLTTQEELDTAVAEGYIPIFEGFFP